MSFGRDDQKYYVMKSLYKNGTNYLPIDSEDVEVRPIISKERVEQLIDMIPELEVRVLDDVSVKEMSAKYDELINGNNCLDLLRLYLSINKKKQQLQEEKKKFGATDDSYLKKSADLLFQEMAAALQIDLSEVFDYIKRRTGFDIS